MRTKPKIVVLGYSGHAYVLIDALLECGLNILGYCDTSEKEHNPFDLVYLGDEKSPHAQSMLQDHPYIIGIGENNIRYRILNECGDLGYTIAPAIIHPRSYIARNTVIESGALVCAHATVNAQSRIERGAIINTGAIIEHDTRVGVCSHIAPGSVLLGGVTVGNCTLIGAGSVVLPGVKVGSNCKVGAGTVVTRDVHDATLIYGNPGKIRK